MCPATLARDRRSHSIDEPLGTKGNKLGLRFSLPDLTDEPEEFIIYFGNGSSWQLEGFDFADACLRDYRMRNSILDAVVRVRCSNRVYPTPMPAPDTPDPDQLELPFG